MTATDIAEKVFRNLADTGPPAEALRLVAVPGSAQTRWLLPAGEPEIGAVLASWTPYRAWPRMAWGVVRAASGFSCTAALPGVAEFEVDGVDVACWQSLGWRGSRTPVPVIYVGTPGPRRKAVVHLVDRATAECRAVVKVPLTEEANTAILHEADVLQALERERYPWAPRLLHLDRTRGLATQTFVTGRPATRKLAPEYWRLLRTLQRTEETTSLSSHRERWACDNAAWAMRELEDDTRLPSCWEHGDFTPWNIRRLSDGECALLDWENARRNGLPLLDAFHFLHMQDFLFGERPRLHAASLCDEAQAMGIATQHVRKLEIAYLLGAAADCAGSGNDERLRFVSHTLHLIRERTA